MVYAAPDLIRRTQFEPHSPLAWRRLGITASQTFRGRQVLVAITGTGTAITVTLATSLMNDSPDARIVIIKDEGGGAAANNITIATEGSETIDGESTIKIQINYGMAMLYSNGSNWFILEERSVYGSFFWS